jgi:hypothetical protein
MSKFEPEYHVPLGGNLDCADHTILYVFCMVVVFLLGLLLGNSRGSSFHD